MRVQRMSDSLAKSMKFFDLVVNQDEVVDYNNLTITFDMIRDTWINLIIESPNFNKVFVNFFYHSDDDWDIIIDESSFYENVRENKPIVPYFSFNYLSLWNGGKGEINPLELDYVKNYFGVDYEDIRDVIDECCEFFEEENKEEI